LRLRVCVSLLTVFLFTAGLPCLATANEVLLTVISFNVESDRDTDPGLVAGDIAAISEGVDLFGLAEVSGADDAETFKRAAEREDAPFRYLLATHGNEDRLAILYNLSTLKFKEVFELDRFPGSRKALVGHFALQSSGVEFLFIVNHFNRRDGDRRRRQAALIRDWVLDQELPAILVGDHNFDFDPGADAGNEAYEIFTADPGLVWIKPECVASRTCPPTGTQCDHRYNSITDLVLIADQGRKWRAASDVMFQSDGYCSRDRSGHSDHRPVLGLIQIR
jgi:hypothetical protein